MEAEERRQRDEEIARIREEMSRPVPAVVAAGTVRPASPSSSSDSDDSDSSSSSSSSDSSDDDDDDNNLAALSFPVHHAVTVPPPLSSAGSKASAIKQLAWDANRTRLVTGALDGTTCLWDTSSSSSALLRPVRELSLTSATTGAATDQCVVSLDFNRTGQLVAVARRDAQIRIFDRDGTNGKGGREAKFTTTLGDVALWDMKKTKGHVGAVAQASFSHVRDAVLFSAGELDGTLRLWDVDKGPRALMGLELACTHTLVYPAKPGSKNSVQAFCHDAQSAVLYAATGGECLRVWDSRAGGSFGALPSLTANSLCVVRAGAGAGVVVSMQLAEEELLLLAARRDVVEAWDARNLKSALWQYRPPSSSSSQVRSVSSVPNARRRKTAVAAAAAVVVNCSDGLVFLRRDTGEEIGRGGGRQAEESSAAVVFTSNLAHDDGRRQPRFIRGTQDGSLVVTYGEDDAASVSSSAASTANKPPQQHRSQPDFYAQVDESKLGESGGAEAMPAAEAFKMIKANSSSNKRVKQQQQQQE